MTLFLLLLVLSCGVGTEEAGEAGAGGRGRSLHTLGPAQRGGGWRCGPGNKRWLVQYDNLKITKIQRENLARWQILGKFQFFNCTTNR